MRVVAALLGLIGLSLLSGCVAPASDDVVSAGQDPMHLDGGPEQVVLEGDDRVLLLDVPEGANASVTWGVPEPEEGLGLVRAHFGVFLLTPDMKGANWTYWSFDVARPPILRTTHDGTGLELGSHPDLGGFLWNVPFDVTFPLAPGPNALILTSHGIRLLVDVQLNPASLWEHASWVEPENDVSRFYSTRNTGEFDEHTELTVGPNVAIKARTEVEMVSEFTILRARTFASEGHLRIDTPTPGGCEDHGYTFLPTGMRASAYYVGPGAYTVDVLGTASLGVPGTEVSIHALDVPFWPAPQAPFCFG